MTKSELIAFLEYSYKWFRGADTPMPQPSDSRIAQTLMIKILRECVDDSDDVIDIVLKDYEFNHFVCNENEEH